MFLIQIPEMFHLILTLGESQSEGLGSGSDIQLVGWLVGVLVGETTYFIQYILTL